MVKIKDSRGKEPTFIVEGNRVTNQRSGASVEMPERWNMGDLKRAQRRLSHEVKPC